MGMGVYYWFELWGKYSSSSSTKFEGLKPKLFGVYIFGLRFYSYSSIALSSSCKFFKSLWETFIYY
jgi:hypothetical protein